MDPALQAMLSGQGGGHGNMRLFGAFPDLEPAALETILPIGQLTLDELMKKLFPMMQQALVFNFPGGFIWRTFFQKILEILRQQHESHAIGNGREASHSDISTPTLGGHDGGGSGWSLDH